MISLTTFHFALLPYQDYTTAYTVIYEWDYLLNRTTTPRIKEIMDLFHEQRVLPIEECGDVETTFT